jgi:collagenase-like PrtC family protease
LKRELYTGDKNDMTIKNSIEFSLGYNFDPELIDVVHKLNLTYGGQRRITEFFAALPDGPYLSTRPGNRILNTSWGQFEQQLKRMKEHSISFNYLFNAKTDLNEIDLSEFKTFLNKLFEIGVSKLIAYSPELCSFIKKGNPDFEVTISSVYNIRSKSQLDEVHASGADCAYLDSIFINRNFHLLRELRDYARIPLKLYANVSCLSQCLNKDLHYTALSSSDKSYQVEMNDKLFKYCSLEKLNNPLVWLQMQWIRPEDIDAYVEEGFNHFKLTDRLAPTETLSMIAEHYLQGKSPDDLFPIMERNGSKFKSFATANQKPIFVANSKIPTDFIEHFRKGECNSTDINCRYCNEIALQAIHVYPVIISPVAHKRCEVF